MYPICTVVRVLCVMSGHSGHLFKEAEFCDGPFDGASLGLDLDTTYMSVCIRECLCDQAHRPGVAWGTFINDQYQVTRFKVSLHIIPPLSLLHKGKVFSRPSFPEEIR